MVLRATVPIAQSAEGFGNQDWFDAWFEAFAPVAHRHTLILPVTGFKPELIPGTSRVLRLPISSLRAPVNDHTPRYGWTFDPDGLPQLSDLHRALSEALRMSHARILQLGFLPERGSTLSLTKALGATGKWILAVDQAECSSLINTSGDWDAYLESRPVKMMKNLLKREKKLRQIGEVEFLDIARFPEWTDWLENALTLEASGWKGRQGSAILQRENEARFYRRITRSWAAQGSLRLFLLLLDGRLIASRLMAQQGATLYAIKIAYDEAFASFSPGLILLRMTLKACFDESSVLVVDLCGSGQWKHQWATHSERLMTVRMAPAGTIGAHLLRTEIALKRLRGCLSSRSA